MSDERRAEQRARTAPGVDVERLEIGPARLVPLPGDPDVLVLTGDGRLAAFDPDTLWPLWSAMLAVNGAALRRGGDVVHAGPTDPRTLLVREARSGALRARPRPLPPRQPLTTPMVRAEGRRVVAQERTRRLRWRADLGAPVIATAIAPDAVYAATLSLDEERSMVHALDAATGAPRWTWRADVDPKRGRCALAPTRGAVVLVAHDDAPRGTRLRRLRASSPWSS